MGFDIITVFIGRSRIQWLSGLTHNYPEISVILAWLSLRFYGKLPTKNKQTYRGNWEKGIQGRRVTEATGRPQATAWQNDGPSSDRLADVNHNKDNMCILRIEAGFSHSRWTKSLEHLR